MSKKTKKEPPKQGEVVKLTFGMIDGFLANQSILKLRQLKGLRSELRTKIFELWETVVNSPAAKALNNSKDVLVKEHEATQMKLKEEDRKPLKLDAPQVVELLDTESELQVRKLIILTDQLPGEFTPFDMSAVTWIIDFEG